MHSCFPVAYLGVDVGADVEERSDSIEMAGGTRPVQWRAAAAVTPQENATTQVSKIDSSVGNEGTEQNQHS